MQVTDKTHGTPGTLIPTPAMGAGSGMVTLAGGQTRWYSAAQVRRFLIVKS